MEADVHDTTWAWLIILVMLAGVVGLGHCGAAKQHPIFERSLPLGTPACDKDTHLRMLPLPTEGPWPDMLIFCFKTREDAYAWHRMLAEPIR